MKLVRQLLLFLAVALPISALAYEELGQEEYFKVPENQLKFETLKAAGAIAHARQQASALCRQWTTEKEKVEQRCECAAKEINKIDDKTLFYVSLMAYERYLAKTEALEREDQKEFEALKAQFAENPLPLDELEDVCL
jgi:hypothetical protein